jgi:SAM-dependent methyltransferase
MSVGFYEDNAEDFFRRTVDADMAPGYATFLALLPSGAQVLDAGCGSGRDARAFRDLGFDVTAIEASPKLAALARDHTGLPVEVMTFDQVVWRDTFDGLWASASLLHVPRADLPATMRRLRGALRPGGVWWMSFKYGAGERETNGRRFTDLDESAARDLVKEVGGLSLLSLTVSTDVRADHPGERWLSLVCRRDA